MWLRAYLPLTLKMKCFMKSKTDAATIEPCTWTRALCKDAATYPYVLPYVYHYWYQIKIASAMWDTQERTPTDGPGHFFQLAARFNSLREENG